MSIPSNIAVIDTETTGIDTKTAKIVEFAIHNDYGVSYSTLVNPDMKIPPETSAVHHISDEDVMDFMKWEQRLPEVLDLIRANGITTLVAHNVAYDREILGPAFEVAWICTYKCALRQWPDAPSHKNEALRYWLNLQPNGRHYSQQSHSALHDVKITYQLLNELLKYQDLETLMRWSNEPKFFSKISFGKHAGKKWEEIDSGYLIWMTKQSDMDPDIVACAKRDLQRRK